jgi:alpha-glucoside transport system permease protein
MIMVLGVLTLIGLVAAGAFSLYRLFGERPVKAGIISASILALLILIFGVGGVSVGDFFGGDQMDRVLEMLGTVLISVGVCVGLWVVLNLFVSQADRQWSQFSGLVGAVLGAGLFGLLRGNRSIGPLFADVDSTFDGTDPLLLFDAAGVGFLGHVEWPLFGAIVFGGGFFLIKQLKNRVARLGVAAAIGILSGVLIARNTKILQRPEPDWLAIILATLILAGVGAALGRRSGRLERGALLGAGVGWAIGGWLLSPFQVVIDVPYISTVVPLVLVAMAFAWQGQPSPKERALFDARARAFIFLGPALGFLFAALVVPAVRTAVLSFQNRAGDGFVGLDNYEELFTAEASADVSNWTDIFSSNLFFVAVLLLLIGVIVALVSGKRRNGTVSFEGGPTSTGTLMLAAFILSVAVLSVLRGTFFNNLWWVITVVTVATVVGLAVAVLADRAVWGQNLAKSLIFMPMAISLVGASIVWRLQFQARPPDRTQTGALNAVWIALGRLSNSGWPRVLMIVVLAVITAWAIWQIVERLRTDRPFTSLSILFVVAGWLLYRFIGPRLGGFTTNAQGEIVPETVQFLTERPFNNMWLMVILIWMQTGFAMVIFSAAIKAVPTEFIEAAKMDGATESQSFFNVTLPTILPTLGVVVTTMIVQVTKVYDIVAVAGLNGIFGNNVLANQMFTESFLNLNRGFGAAIAMVMFLLVLPVMVYNIYNMQKEAI